jgi:hypothetical protein
METDQQRLLRWLAALALGGTAIFVVAVLALHWLQPKLSPLDEAMSYYVHGAHGWLMTVGLLAIGVGSLALTIGLARVLEGRLARVGIEFLAVWSVGAILGGAFSADPPGNWDQPPSLSGAIHGIAALVALTAFPVAAATVTAILRRHSRFNRISGAATILAVTSVVSFIAFAGSLVPVFVRPGPPLLLGLTERVLFGAYAAWLAVVAIGLIPAKNFHAT